MIVEVLKVFLEAMRLIAEAVRVTVSHESACRASMRGKAQAVRVLLEAMILIEALKKDYGCRDNVCTVEAVRMLA